MPSGSHGSRGGSHFGGGGSRSSGSSFGSSSRSSFGRSTGGSHFGSSRGGYGGHVHVHFGPRRIWLGRGHYYYNGNSSPATLGFVLAFFALFFAFFFGVAYSGSKNDVKLIEQDYEYYQDMIDYAKANDEYIVDAIVTGKYYNDYAEKYYITYEIDLPNSFFPLEGETYSCYTLTETGKYRIGSTIKVAVDDIPVTMNTDSIPMDYDSIPLENDGEYVKATKSVTTNLIWMLALIGVAILIIAITIRYMYKHSKVEDKKEETEKVEEKEETTVTCKYCGGVFDKSKTKCPDCGASLRR